MRIAEIQVGGRLTLSTLSSYIMLGVLIGCGGQDLAPNTNAASGPPGTASEATAGAGSEGSEGAPAAVSIDQRSYRLGGIGAFAEMVGAGVKQLALSAAMPEAEMDALFDEAKAVAENNGAEVYLETDFLVTDLFPAEITDGMQVLLIYRGRTLQDYTNLKERKRLLVEAGSYEGDAREDIARDMGRLLSYPEEKITSLLSRPQGEGS